jgi:hypothetical protein
VLLLKLSSSRVKAIKCSGKGGKARQALTRATVPSSKAKAKARAEASARLRQGLGQ